MRVDAAGHHDPHSVTVSRSAGAGCAGRTAAGSQSGTRSAGSSLSTRGPTSRTYTRPPAIPPQSSWSERRGEQLGDPPGRGAGGQRGQEGTERGSEEPPHGESGRAEGRDEVGGDRDGRNGHHVRPADTRRDRRAAARARWPGRGRRPSTTWTSSRRTVLPSGDQDVGEQQREGVQRPRTQARTVEDRRRVAPPGAEERRDQRVRRARRQHADRQREQRDELGGRHQGRAQPLAVGAHPPEGRARRRCSGPSPRMAVDQLATLKAIM